MYDPRPPFLFVYLNKRKSTPGSGGFAKRNILGNLILVGRGSAVSSYVVSMAVVGRVSRHAFRVARPRGSSETVGSRLRTTP